jgi:Carboxypeptidase regulatory-like domain
MRSRQEPEKEGPIIKRAALSILTTGVLLVTVSAPSLWGQAVASGQISGLVTDPSGAVVPGTKITATQTETGLVRTTSSGPSGSYLLTNLPVGSYKLEVQANGFRSYVQTGIILQVGSAVNINVEMRLGQVSQHVQVSANARMVQTQSTSISQVIEQRRVIDLPLNGRNATELVMLAGAANDVPTPSPSSNSDLISSKNYFSSDAISVAGDNLMGRTI